MAELGVPIDEATAKDHIQVRAKLVRRLGGANEALVWSRIYYRAAQDQRAAVEVEGMWWWPATYELLAEQTGLTQKQARAAVNALAEAGYIDRLQLSGKSYSYRARVIEHLPSGADSRIDASAQEGSSIGPAGQLDLPWGADAPSTRQKDVKTRAESFDEFWSAYPRHVAKEAARKAFEKAVKSTAAAVIIAGAARFAADPNLPEKTYVPYPASWLNAGQWDDEPLPQREPSARPRDADDAEEWMRR